MSAKLCKQECQAETQGSECKFPDCNCPMEEYTPPTPLELEQLEEAIREKVGNHIGSLQLIFGYRNFIKPLISSLLQAKDERIKELERAVKKVSWIGESLQTQLQEKESEIAQLKKELEDKKAVG